jgi:hypothetical protein
MGEKWTYYIVRFSYTYPGMNGEYVHVGALMRARSKRELAERVDEMFSRLPLEVENYHDTTFTWVDEPEEVCPNVHDPVRMISWEVEVPTTVNEWVFKRGWQ